MEANNILSKQILNSKEGKTAIYSVGQAGFIFESKSGQQLAVDIFLSDYVQKVENSDGYKRLLPCILGSKDIILDCVIATHSHADHYDVDSMPDIMNNGKTILLASENCRTYVEQQHIDLDRVSFVKPGDVISKGDFEIYFVDCDHGAGAPDAVGVIVEFDGIRIYETGDTCLRLDFAEKIKKMGAIDILIAPINGAYGNLNEYECVKLSDYIRPRFTIPCHYGMFASHGGNLRVFYDEMKKKNLPLYLMSYGEKLLINEEG